jgi:hypothetical protein
LLLNQLNHLQFPQELLKVEPVDATEQSFHELLGFFCRKDVLLLNHEIMMLVVRNVNVWLLR